MDYMTRRSIILDAVSPVKRVKLAAELSQLALEASTAKPLEKVAIARKVAAIVAQLQGKPDVDVKPVILPASSLEAKAESVTVWLTEAKLRELEVKVKAFEKRAAKLGVAPMTITRTGNTRTLRVIGRDTDSGAEYRAVQMTVQPKSNEYPAGVIDQFEVTLTGELPQLAGWRFVASLEHTEGGNLVKSMPGGGNVPDRYLTAQSVCEHCGTKRNRNKTVVCAHTDGRFVQVGSNCLKDFLGHGDAETLAQLLEWRSNMWATYMAEYYPDEGFQLGGFVPSMVELSLFLIRVAQMIRLYGYVSRSRGEEELRVSTADEAMGALRNREKAPEPSAEDEAKAKAAQAWAAALTDDEVRGNTFLHNLRVIAGSQGVSLKNLGMAAAIIVAYDKSREEARDKAITANSEHQGEVGKRGKFPGLLVEKIIASESAYGMTYIHKFRDKAGNVFTWFSSGTSLDEGTTYDVTATVKKHDEYNGVKQTVLLRVKGEEVQGVTDSIDIEV